MEISPVDLEAEYGRALAEWPFIAALEITYGLPGKMLFAVGSRETNLTNEVGDGGHGHGVWQLDDRSHVIPPGFDSNVLEQCHTAAGMLASLMREFGTAKPGPVVCALAAYNAGAGTVDYNLSHNLPVDTGTANGNYSEDTLARMVFLQDRYPGHSPVPPSPTTGDAMPPAWLVMDAANVAWVVSADLAGKVRVVDAGALAALRRSGYKELGLGHLQLGFIQDLTQLPAKP